MLIRPASLPRSPLLMLVLSWVVRSCRYSASSIRRGPYSVWLLDSCRLLRWQRMKQSYIMGQLWGGDRQKPAESIKPLFEPTSMQSCLALVSLASFDAETPSFCSSPHLLCIFLTQLHFFFRLTSFISAWLPPPSLLSLSAPLLGLRWTYDIQWNCNHCKEIEKGGRHLRKKRQRPKGLPKAIQFVSAPCMCVSSSFFFFQLCGAI